VTSPKTCLGDGAYASIEHGELVLTTENGISTTNRIVLGPTEWQALKLFVERTSSSSWPQDFWTRA
jgi:hypothetical protein